MSDNLAPNALKPSPKDAHQTVPRLAPKNTQRLVQKFGGSSVADIEKIKHVASIIAKAANEGNEVVAVVSAMGKTTDGLVALAQQLTPHPTANPTSRDYDMLLATGEMVSAALTAMALNAMGHKAVALNGQQAGICTEDLHNNARILDIKQEHIERHLKQGSIVIITGFQGSNQQGDFCTLGRGGSDTSAVAIAAALKANRCDIYTDVAGVYSTDPRLEPQAEKLEEIAYIEMLELARLGAKVLHPRSVETARHFNVALCVRSTFELENPGTMVIGEEALESNRRVAGVACDMNQARLAIAHVPDQPGIAAKVFNRLAEANVSVDMIIQSLGADGHFNDIAFTVSTTDLHTATHISEKVCAELGAREVLVDEDIAKVSIVGVGMIDRPGIAADMFQALAEANINIKMISTSEIKISCLVEKDKANLAVRLIHSKFFAPQKALLSERAGY